MQTQELEQLRQRCAELEQENSDLKYRLERYIKHAIRRDFHGYTLCSDGTILNKKGLPLKFELRPRNGGGVDQCVRLYVGGKMQKFTVQRLIAAAFQGPIFGYEINHKDRVTTTNENENLERLTPSQNQRHWRGMERKMI